MYCTALHCTVLYYASIFTSLYHTSQCDVQSSSIRFLTDGVAPETAQRLVESLKDYASDFRVSKSHLSKLKFAVFGLGGSDYSVHFCRAAKDINGTYVQLYLWYHEMQLLMCVCVCVCGFVGT